MALSKTLNANGSKGHHYFSLTVTEVSTTTTTSSLNFTFTMAPIQNAYNFYDWGTLISYSLNIGGYQYTGYIPNYDGYSILSIRSESGITITHDNDGKKTIIISFSVTDNSGASYTPGNASASDTFKLSDLHKPPVVDSYTVEETNSILTNVSLSNSTFVTNLSKKKFTLNNTFYDGASGSRYFVNITSPNNRYTYSSNPFTVDFTTNSLPYTYNSSGEPICYIGPGVIDNKGSTNEVTYGVYNVIIYNKPNIVVTESSVKRNGQTSGKARMNLKGTYSNRTIGNKTNTITLSFKYWRFGASEPSSYDTIPTSAYSLDGDNFSMYNWDISIGNNVISDLDKSYAYYFKVRVADSFGGEHIVTLVCSKGEYIMAKYKNRVDFKKVTINNYEVPYASMCTIFTNSVITGITTETTISNFSRTITVGDYGYDSTNKGIIIRNSTVVKLSGKISGFNGVSTSWYLYNRSDMSKIDIGSRGYTIFINSGNGAVSGALAPLILSDLDPTKEYVLRLSVSPYQSSAFNLNDGFDTDATYITAEKVL